MAVQKSVKIRDKAPLSNFTQFLSHRMTKITSEKTVWRVLQFAGKSIRDNLNTQRIKQWGKRIWDKTIAIRDFYESHLLVLLDVFKTSFLVAESLGGVVPEKRQSRYPVRKLAAYTRRYCKAGLTEIQLWLLFLLHLLIH